MNTIPVSIILSTYNRQKFLETAIENILKQTFSIFELIIINDGSTDQTAQICERFAQEDSRIRFINLEKNGGLSKARELGVRLARGEYLTFIDDDDICENNMIEFLYNLAINNQADISICGGVNDYGDRIEPVYVYDQLYIFNKVEGLDEYLKREKFNTAPATKLFKRKLFEHVSFLENVKIDDIHVIYKVFAEAEKVAAHGKPLYRWVKHGENISSFIQTNKLNPEILDEYIPMQKQRIEYLSNKVPEIAPRVRYAAWSYMISMCNKIKTYHCDNCEKQYEQMIQILKENLDEFESSPFITDRERALLKQYVK
jgi:glycosyltransferase involved in cell wall biosynthesis